LPENLLIINERLKGVCIENLDFRKALKRYSQNNALVYADPPYLAESRDYGTDYKHELSEQDHIELSELLHERKGPVVISGYSSKLYEELYKGWFRTERSTRCCSNRKRTEVIWIKGLKNPPVQGELF
jgi:DNA adenine methylase